MKRKEPRPMSDVINDMLARTGLLPEYRRASAAAAWREVVGEAISNMTNACYVREKTLYVHISSASLKEQLGFMRTQLVERINRQVGADVINNIVIR